MGSALAMADLGVTGHVQQESYIVIVSWLKVLKNEKNSIFSMRPPKYIVT
ncbi:hypothetical protein JY436_02030 [Serratia marcescens]|nr:hypothetical protein [Serratia marcescens]